MIIVEDTETMITCELFAPFTPAVFTLNKLAYTYTLSLTYSHSKAIYQPSLLFTGTFPVNLHDYFFLPLVSAIREIRNGRVRELRYHPLEGNSLTFVLPGLITTRHTFSLSPGQLTCLAQSLHSSHGREGHVLSLPPDLYLFTSLAMENFHMLVVQSESDERGPREVSEKPLTD